MPKMDNLLAILWMLSSNKKITASQIAERLEINIRTVYRYIDTLSTSGVPIISDSGHNGGYMLLNQFIKTPLFFNPDEQTALFHAAVFAKNSGYYGEDALNRAISKLRNYSNEKQEKDMNHHLTSLEVINGVNSLSLNTFLNELEKAIAHGYSVTIQYAKNKALQSSSRLVDPYKIIYWNNNWYMIGFCHLRNDIRSFRIERIKNLLPTENKFNQPVNFSASSRFLKNLLPSIKEKDLVRFVINGNESALNDISQHWFLGHYLHEKAPTQLTFLLERNTLHTYVPHLLLSYGTSIQIIEPLSFKERLVEVLSELKAFHQL